jgi:hypothetical protein
LAKASSASSDSPEPPSSARRSLGDSRERRGVLQLEADLDVAQHDEQDRHAAQ